LQSANGFVPFDTSLELPVTSLTASPQHVILHPDEPHPLETRNGGGRSDFVLICEHAGRLMPRSLGTLGLGEGDLTRHIAWDIGAKAVAVALSDLLDAPLFMQRYSRLVCDCNRRPDVASFTPEMRELPECLLKQATKTHDGPHRHFHKHAEEGGAIVVDTLEGVLKEAGEIISAKIQPRHLVE
jgi:hypothetical protein